MVGEIMCSRDRVLIPSPSKIPLKSTISAAERQLGGEFKAQGVYLSQASDEEVRDSSFIQEVESRRKVPKSMTVNKKKSLC